MSESPQVEQQIQSLIGSDKVVLFMKGTRSFPQCGFSATVVQILNQVVPDYTTVNVLSEPEIRQGIKEFSNWPTIPQLYVGGEFVGGCDIIQDMFGSGDLHQALGVVPEKVEPPTLHLSDKAEQALKDALGDLGPSECIRVSVSERFEHGLNVEAKRALDALVEVKGLRFIFDGFSAKRANGLSIDFQDGPEGTGFKIDNPNAPAPVVELSPAEFQKKLEAGEFGQVLDVRTPEERDKAVINPSRRLDDDTMDELDELDRETPIAFFCHHGIRSRSAAQHYLEKGFRKVFNLQGGIDKWSQLVDSKVPRY